MTCGVCVCVGWWVCGCGWVYIYIHIYMCVGSCWCCGCCSKLECVRDGGGWLSHTSSSSQAFAAWQWWNYLCKEISGDRVPLRINMDETSICLYQGAGKGAVFTNRKRPGRERTQKVASNKRRCCLTYVSFVCDRPDLQPLLPQVIVGNERTFPLKFFVRLKAACPPNVRLVRQKSAWNNGVLCAEIVRWLGEALRPHLSRYQPILLMDAVRLHTSQQVFSACNRVQIWLLLVPALMTRLMQPLDTDGFQPFKINLRGNYQEARALADGADLSIEQFMPCLYRAIRRVIQGRQWARAFDKAGFGQRQRQLSSLLTHELQLEEPACVGEVRPSLEQLRHCFPRRSIIPVSSLWQPFDGAPAVLALPHRVQPRGLRCVSSEAVPIYEGRTRADRHSALIAGTHGAAASSVSEEAPQLPRGVLLRRVLPSTFVADARPRQRCRRGDD